MQKGSWISHYFRFSRKERLGIFTLLLLMTTGLLYPTFRRYFSPAPTAIADSSWIIAAQRLMVSHDSATDAAPSAFRKYANQDRDEHDRTEKQAPVLFPFDPNTIAVADWERLGVSAKTARTILNYLSKGGRFRKAEDLARIYGLRESDYQRLAPYIIIQAAHRLPTLADSATRKSHVTKKLIVDVNTADTTALIALPGIGSKLAGRITAFREKLGGFHSIEQLREVYGITDTTFEKLQKYLRLDHSIVKQIDINSALYDELRNHPYIRQGLAKLIVAYRQEHGGFSDLSQLRKIKTIDEGTLVKLMPYLKVK